jgi:protein TonB
MSATAELDGYRGRGLGRQPLAGPAAGSVLLHAGLAGALVLYGIVGGFFKHNLWGSPGTGGAIQVSLVSSALPLPADQAPNENVLTTEKPSQAPAAPSPKDKEMVDDSAIAISGKEVKPQEETTPKTQPHQPTPKTNDLAQFGEQSGSQMARATQSQATPAVAPVSITNSDFGSRFGWYEEVIRRKVDQNWNKPEVDPRTAKGSVAEIYFRINRQGNPSSFKINKASGSSTLDQSCLRATQRVDTFGALPPQSNDQWLDVTYDCTY